MERQAQARLQLRQQRQRFFSNPVNLLLPFTTGALLAAGARRRSRGRNHSSGGSSLSGLLVSGLKLWSASEGLRHGLLGSSGPDSEHTS